MKPYLIYFSILLTLWFLVQGIEYILTRRLGRNSYRLEMSIHKCINRLRNIATSRTGSGWHTGDGFVGYDMKEGLDLVSDIIQDYNFDNGKPFKIQCHDLSSQIRMTIDFYNGNDREGFVTGTMVDVALHIELLELTWWMRMKYYVLEFIDEHNFKF
jgi:hypothetical protein